MNWYPFYYGDYGRDTGHLSLVEEGAYRRLLDHYYATGPLDANALQMHRVCRCINDEEKKAVETVMAWFFTLHEGKYHNKRADIELAKQDKITGNRRKSALLRWGKEKSGGDDKGMQMDVQKDMQTQCKRNANGYAIHNHSINTPLPPKRGMESRRMTATEKKRFRVECNTDLMVRVGGWRKFRRGASTLWSMAEREALVQLFGSDEISGLAEGAKSELLIVERRYQAEIDPQDDIRRTSILTLLNNWTGEVDRSRSFFEKNQKNVSVPNDTFTGVE